MNTIVTLLILSCVAGPNNQCRTDKIKEMTLNECIFDSAKYAVEYLKAHPNRTIIGGLCVKGDVSEYLENDPEIGEEI